MAGRQKNDARLVVRLSQPDKELIDRAALLLGQSVSGFAVSTLVEKARRVVEENGTVVLSDGDRDIFLAMLDADAQPNEALKRAARRYKARPG